MQAGNASSEAAASVPTLIWLWRAPVLAGRGRETGAVAQ